MFDVTYADAIKNAPHLIALGKTTVFLRDDGNDFPWSKATDVEVGSSYRLSGPDSCYIIAADAGLTFKLSVRFEGRDANGRGASLFERGRLREVMRKLPEPARLRFAEMLSTNVLPGIEKRSSEIREALNANLDSEDCVRGLIAFAHDIGA